MTKGEKYMDNILEFKNIRKEYPGVVALKDININVRRGEVLGLVGENGAGKSTLIKVCSGAISPTSGKILYEGKEHGHFTPSVSMDLGINVIYQEFNLVNEMSVLDNIFLGNYPKKNGMVDRSEMKRRAADVFQQLGISIDTEMKVHDLSVGFKQFVEIAKAVSKETKVLILDEPSATLTNKEVDMLLEIVKNLKKSGVTIIYISHRLEEVFEICDRVSVLRDGEYIATVEADNVSREELVHLMVGRELNESFPEREPVPENAPVIFEARNLSGNGDSDISFSLRKGEILGFGGIVGAGRTELAQMICGLIQPESGEMFYNGEPYKPKDTKAAMAQGIVLAPEDRKQQGVVLDFSIKENVDLSNMKSVSWKFVINKKAEKALAESFRKRLKIKCSSIQQKVLNLSGGNQQKVVLARLLACHADIIIFDEPTRGIDVGAKQEVYHLMNDLIREGKSIIMISSELPELMGMSDRIVVLAEGKKTGEFVRSEFTQEKILNQASIS